MGFFIDDESSASPALTPGFFIDEGPAEPSLPAGAFDDSSKLGHFGNTLLGGGTKFLDYATLGVFPKAVAGGSALLDALRGDAPVSDAYEQRLAQLRGAADTFSDEGGLFGEIATGAGSFATPVPKLFSAAKGLLPAAGNVTKGAALGGAYGGLAGFNAEDGDWETKIASGLDHASTGAIAGGALTGLAEGVQGVARGASELGRKTELSAFGAGKRRVDKAVSRMPDILDDTGDFQNPLSKALESFRVEGGGKAGMDGVPLYRELNAQIRGHADDLRTVLGDAQRAQKDVIVPGFQKTESYIEQLAGTDKAKAKEIAAEEIANTLNNTDGTILSLQDEKVKLGKSISEGAWGDDQAGRLRTNILKRIKSDLRTSIEENYQSLTGRSSSEVAKINEAIGQRQGLIPLFKDIITTGESRNPVGWLLQNMRTSGGLGTLGLGLTYGGAPAVAGLGAPLAGAFLATPTGRKTLADALRSVPKWRGAIETGSPRLSGLMSILASGQSGSQPEGSEQVATPILKSRPLLPKSQVQQQGNSPATRQNRELPIRSASSLEENRELDLSDNIQAFAGSSARPAQRSEDKISSSSKSSPISIDQAMKKAEAQMEEAPKEPKPTKIAMEKAPKLVKAIIAQESGGNPKAVGFETEVTKKAGERAQGLMQIMPSTAKEIAEDLGVKEYDLTDPETNIKFGTHYIEKLIKNFHGNAELALAAYHAGETRVRKWIKRYGPTWSMIEAGLKKDNVAPNSQKYTGKVLARLSKIDSVDV